MGSSPKIVDMQATNKEFQDYLNNIQQDLDTKTATALKQMQADISTFYTTNNYTDGKIMVQGKNAEFMHESEFSLENIKKVIDSISAAVFANQGAPAGADVDKSTVADAEKSLGAAVGAMANLELYMASKVLDVMSSVLLSFGKTTSVSYNTTTENKSLAYGIQMFATVSASSYRSSSFFNNEYINQYMFVYDVRFSAQQAKTEQMIGLVQLYSNQLAAYESMLNELLNQLISGAIGPEKYSTLKKIYIDFIAETKAEIVSLKGLDAMLRPSGTALPSSAPAPGGEPVSNYQVLQTLDGTVYCSSEQFEDPGAAAGWIKNCILKFNIPARNLHRTYGAQSHPAGAVIWP